MRHFLQNFRRLQWKLTLSYALTTILALLLVEILVFSVAFLFIWQNAPDVLRTRLQEEALQISPYFASTTPAREAVVEWLNLTNSREGNEFSNSPDRFLAVTDSQGRVIASIGSRSITANMALQTQLPAQAATNLHRVLTGADTANGLVSQQSDSTVIMIIPIVGTDKMVKGVLVGKMPRLAVGQEELLLGLFPILLPSVLVFTVIAVAAGTVFGFLTARGLTRRLKKLSSAADNWSQGDFTVFVQETSGDELGQLTNQFNRMAGQLQNLLQAHQALATLEERNRLARDLHDSVKQQVFALAMQVSSAKMLLDRDIEAAREQLAEAEQLVYQSQQELTSLLSELRPAALDGKGLATALSEYVAQWSRQASIAADVHVAGGQSLPLTIEEALFRVAQEALANVARHSHATTAHVTLKKDEEGTIILRISDNGKGFDPHTAKNGGMGLYSMRERIELAGGNIDIESAAGKGTTVTAYCRQVSVHV